MKHGSRRSWGLLALLMLLAGCRQTAELGETSWELVAYGPAEAPLAAEAPGSISFEDNGRMGGSTGCNSFFGNYEAEDGRLTWRDGELAFTVVGCDPASAAGRQDAFFREWLVMGAEYSQTADRLVLFFDDGQQVAEYRLGDE